LRAGKNESPVFIDEPVGDKNPITSMALRSVINAVVGKYMV
jgi:hypothetical protein